MQLTNIFAMGLNREIGAGNRMPWKLPAEMAYFKKKTLGHTVLMGRKTFESIGGKPLSGRRNVVMTRDRTYTAEGVAIVHSLEEALQELSQEEQVFNIGGSEMYKLFMPYVDRMLMTRIQHAFPEADAFFPEVDLSEWELVSETPGLTDEKNPYEYVFQEYLRKQ